MNNPLYGKYGLFLLYNLSKGLKILYFAFFKLAFKRATQKISD